MKKRIQNCRKNFEITTVLTCRTYFCCFVLCTLLQAVQPIAAQNPTQASYAKARLVLDASLRAYGGLENLRSVQNFSVIIDGFQYHRNQSRRPDRIDSTPRGYQATFDLANNRYSMVLQRGGVGRDLISYQEFFDGKERIFFNPATQTKNTRPVAPNWKQQYGALFLPPYLLLNAYARLPQLRYVGQVTVRHQPQDVISFAGADGATVTLYIDAKTKLITKQEVLGSDDFLGDAVTETIFSDYRPTGKFAMPHLVITQIAGELSTTLRYKKISFNQELSEAQFKLSVDAKPQPPVSPPDTKVSSLGENIYLVGAGGYRVLFVNFRDYIWVMEAPAGEASREVIQKIKETIPGKPIKYLAVTHFHIDHSGGLRSYVAEGATIITTKGNRAYFEQLAKNSFTIVPDSLSAKPQMPKMEFVESKKRVFTDGITTVELYDIGPSPHAEEILVAYLPKEKIVFEADLFDFPFDDRTLTTAHFAKWMAQKGLDVEKIVPVHGTITLIKDFLAAIAEREGGTK